MTELESIAQELNAIGAHLGEIKTLMTQSQAASDALRAQAEAALAAQAQNTQEYLEQLPGEEPQDLWPFEAMPAGTRARDLAGGGRMFELPDGALLRLSEEQTLVFAGLTGTVHMLTITGRELELPNGMRCTLRLDQLSVTHEAAGIAGLPLAIQPRLAAPDCYAVDLGADLRLIVQRAARTVSIIDPAGTIVVLGQRRAEGIGEQVVLRPISAAGDWAFTSLTSNHRGVLRGDGGIDLILSNGMDLSITFPAQTGGGQPETGPQPCEVCGLEHV